MMKIFEQTNLTRRSFLTTSSLTGAAVLAGGFAPSVLASGVSNPIGVNMAATNTAAPYHTGVSVAEAAALAVQRSIVVAWNQTMVTAVSAIIMPPTLEARSYSIMHEAIYNAWAYATKPVWVKTLPPLQVPITPSQLADPNLLIFAVSQAAYLTLLDLFPTQTTLINNMANSVGLSSPPSQAAVTGVLLGTASANEVLTRRHQDGSNQLGNLAPGAYSDYTGYQPVNTPTQVNDVNHWQPQLVNGVAQQFLTPFWGLVTPYALSSGSALRPAAPYDIQGREMGVEIEEVIRLSAQLDPQQKIIAEYWANGGNWVKAGGTEVRREPWVKYAQMLSYVKQNTLDQDVVMFHMLHQGLHDAVIACWDAKRHFDAVRPITAIRTLFANVPIQAWGGPGQGTQTIMGQNFTPYIPTPAFAEYTSAHSTVGHAGAYMLNRFNGGDNFYFYETIDANVSTIEANLPAKPMKLSWRSFSDAAIEAGATRRHSGLHFKTGDMRGRELGNKVGRVVYAKIFGHE